MIGSRSAGGSSTRPPTSWRREGHDAITIRAVATAAGVQLPAIYRLFGSKDGLLEEVSERSLATFLADREVDPEPHDPLDDLRAGWDLAVEFGLANPALYTLMFTEPIRATSAALQAGTEMVSSRLRRLAVHGLLGVDEVLRRRHRPVDGSRTPCWPGCRRPRTGGDPRRCWPHCGSRRWLR